MVITFDPAKRDWTLINRNLDFRYAEEVFAGPVFEAPDLRQDYGEVRIITIGYLRGRMVVVGWTPRGENRHVFTCAGPTTGSGHAMSIKPEMADPTNGSADPDDIPELTDAFFEHAELKIDGVPLKRGPGRPAPNGAKQQLTLRLDSAVIEGFRATGPGWQARMNDVLRGWLAGQAGSSTPHSARRGNSA